MAVRPPVVGLIKHQLMWVWGVEFMVTTIWVSHSGVATLAMAQADQAVLSAWATNTWRTRARTTCALRQIKSYNMGVSPPVQFAPLDLYPLATITGTASLSAAVPRGVTKAISLRTGAVGETPKPPSGRIFHVGGFNSGQLTSEGDAVSTSVRDDLVSCYDAIRTGFTGVGNIGTWVVVSYYSGGSRAAPVIRPIPSVLPITHVQADTRVDFVHSRLPRQQSYVLN